MSDPVELLYTDWDRWTAAKGLIPESELRAAVLEEYRGCDWDELPDGGIVEWGAYRWVPWCEWSQDYWGGDWSSHGGRSLVKARSDQSPIGQFFATVWTPDRWIPNPDHQKFGG